MDCQWGLEDLGSLESDVKRKPRSSGGGNLVEERNDNECFNDLSSFHAI